MIYRITENGQEQEISAQQAFELTHRDIIYSCEEHSTESLTTHHIHPERSWKDIPEKGEGR